MEAGGPAPLETFQRPSFHTFGSTLSTIEAGHRCVQRAGSGKERSPEQALRAAGGPAVTRRVSAQGHGPSSACSPPRCKGCWEAALPRWAAACPCRAEGEDGHGQTLGISSVGVEIERLDPLSPPTQFVSEPAGVTQAAGGSPPGPGSAPCPGLK